MAEQGRATGTYLNVKRIYKDDLVLCKLSIMKYLYPSVTLYPSLLQIDLLFLMTIITLMFKQGRDRMAIGSLYVTRSTVTCLALSVIKQTEQLLYLFLWSSHPVRA